MRRATVVKVTDREWKEGHTIDHRPGRSPTMRGRFGRGCSPRWRRLSGTRGAAAGCPCAMGSR